MYVTFIIGTAGSGKSLLTKTYSDWLQGRKEYVVKVNLDPGAVTLPYTPDVDVRNRIVIDDLMDKYDLGPNGALVMAADLIATEIDEIRREIEVLKPDYVLVDTPGQMELFAFRVSGPIIISELTKDPKVVIYLFDAAFSSNPLTYVSNLFLATAVHLRFLLPQVYILSKIDLLPSEKIAEILDWSEDANILKTAIEDQLTDEKRLLSRGIVQTIARLGLIFGSIPVSSKTCEGIIDLHALLTRIYTGGEEAI